MEFYKIKLQKQIREKRRIVLQEKHNAKRLAVFGNFVDPTNKSVE